MCAKSYTQTVKPLTLDEPENPRQDMEGVERLDPDDARHFIQDLIRAMYGRVNELPDDQFNKPDGYHRLPDFEKAKQYYGDETWQLLAGIEAALREWRGIEHDGSDIEELKQRYSGTFVEGVEIGERLAPYEDRDFSFDSGSENESKFTFTE